MHLKTSWLLFLIVFCFPISTGLAQDTQDVYETIVTCNYENKPAGEVMADLACQAQVTITVSPEVQGNITIFLGKVTLGEALDKICASTNSFHGLIDERTLVVSSQLDITSPYYQYIAKIQKIPVLHYKVEEIMPTLANHPHIRLVTPDPISNSLVVYAPPMVIARLELDIKELDQPRKLNTIEFTVLDSSGVNLQNFASDWEVTHGVPQENGLWTIQMLGMTFGYRQEGARQILLSLFAYHSQDKLEMLAKPRVTIPDNGSASIFFGKETWVPIRTLVGEAASRLEKIPAGISLKASARIIGPDELIISIQSGEVSELLPIGPSGLVSTTARRIEAPDGIRVKDGETIVIGAMVNRLDYVFRRKVPILGDLPLLGFLFREKRVESRQQEITMLITPRIIKTD